MEREFPEEKIVSTLSRQLTEQFGKGYTKAGIFRMVKVARAFPDAEIVATLSHQLSWSLYIELIAISAPTKHLYFQQMSILYHWSVRQLRDQEDKMVYERSLIAAKPEDEQVKVLTTVADGEIKPEYNGQMELYLKYLKKYEMQPGEEAPIGLLLCSEGNTEHIELLMLDEQNIKVAQYLTVLPEKQWFIDKMNRSIAIAKELQDRKETE